MKKSTTRITAAMTAVLMLFGAGCSNSAQPAATTTTAAETTTTEATTTAAPETEAQTTEAETTTTTEAETPAEEEYPVPESVKVAALKGPTAMGMIKFMDDSDSSENSGYEFEIYAAPDELTPLIIRAR